MIATAGTTLTGAIDPLADLAEVCRAARRLAPRRRRVRAARRPRCPSAPRCSTGSARADSCSVDAHKWLYLPKACGVVLVRDADALAGAFAHESGYLPHQQHELHAADITLEYSRPFRALKLWLAFRVHGAAQFREAIARNLDEADLLYRRAQAIGGLRGARRAAAAVDRPDPAHAPGRRRPRRAQRAARRRDPGRRPRLPGLGADRRPGLAPAVLRELPHDRGGRAGDPRRRARPRAGAWRGEAA